ncbi:MAG: ribosome assembly cofactor RimP [Bacteroidales bacterium]|nr:ribosome assembly cofactor RimP [Bacteroidales bacterium]
MITEKDIANILHEHLDREKYFVVKIKVAPGNKIFLAVDNYTHITLDECAQINQMLVPLLDAIDPDYELEVSSPGLTQPFEVIEQYRKYKNTEVEVLLLSGQKKVGILGDTFENGFNLLIENKIKEEGSKKKIKIIETQFFEFKDVKYTRRKIKF